MCTVNAIRKPLKGNTFRRGPTLRAQQDDEQAANAQPSYL
jgi:hypothetical protein